MKNFLPLKLGNKPYKWLDAKVCITCKYVVSPHSSTVFSRSHHKHYARTICIYPDTIISDGIGNFKSSIKYTSSMNKILRYVKVLNLHHKLFLELNEQLLPTCLLDTRFQIQLYCIEWRCAYTNTSNYNYNVSWWL